MQLWIYKLFHSFFFHRLHFIKIMKKSFERRKSIKNIVMNFYNQSSNFEFIRKKNVKYEKLNRLKISKKQYKKFHWIFRILRDIRKLSSSLKLIIWKLHFLIILNKTIYNWSCIKHSRIRILMSTYCNDCFCDLLIVMTKIARIENWRLIN